MMRAAGLRVAMASATPEVLAAPRGVVPSNREDGVAEAIEWYVLNGRVR